VPTSHDNVETRWIDGTRVDQFSSKNGKLAVRLSDATFPVDVSIKASGDSALGRGVHGAIPLHVVYESRNLTVSPLKPLKFKITLSVS